MDFFYFLVTSDNSWEPLFHPNYFNAAGFTYGVIGALVIGVVLALVFYFGCCNNRNSVKYATKGVWAVFLLIAGVAAYFYADIALIGDPNTTTPGTFSFSEANNEYLIAQTKGAPVEKVTQLTQIHNKIKSDLQKGGDVRFPFALTTAILAILFYFIMSMVVKRFTYAGKAIPLMNP